MGPKPFGFKPWQAKSIGTVSHSDWATRASAIFTMRPWTFPNASASIYEDWVTP